MQKPPKIILGIDPGTLLMGYGIIGVSNSSIVLIEMGALRLTGKDENYRRLQVIHEKVCELLNTHNPSQFAIEAPFFGKNVQSMLKLGRAQGVAIAAAMSFGIPVTEYSPRKIKQSITGNGNAAKEQVWEMLQRMMTIKNKNSKKFDASDALAVAVCHHFQDHPAASINSNGKHKGWSDFIQKNPQRVHHFR